LEQVEFDSNLAIIACSLAASQAAAVLAPSGFR